LEVMDEIFFINTRSSDRFTERPVFMNTEFSWLSNYLFLSIESALQNYNKGDDLSQFFILQPSDSNSI